SSRTSSFGGSETKDGRVTDECRTASRTRRRRQDLHLSARELAGCIGPEALRCRATFCGNDSCLETVTEVHGYGILIVITSCRVRRPLVVLISDRGGKVLRDGE